MKYGKDFFETYCADDFAGKTIVDVGAQDVNGSLREFCPAGATYIGVDFAEGDGVDIVITDPYHLPFENDTVDVIVCSSVFEHSEFFWLLFLECVRITKPSGLIYLNAPSNGMVHRYPIDAWRFYPDAGLALVNWANYNSYNTMLLESFLGFKQGPIPGEGMWNDFVAVILKDRSFASTHARRIQEHTGEFHCGHNSLLETDAPLFADSPDYAFILNQKSALEEALAKQDEQKSLITDLSIKLKAFKEHSAAMSDLASRRHNAALADMSSRLRTAEEQKNDLALQIAAILNSTSWRLTKPLRDYKSVYSEKPSLLARAFVSVIARKAWSLLPVTTPQRVQIKNLLLSSFPIIFKRTKTYQAWVCRAEPTEPTDAQQRSYIPWLDEPLQFIRRSESPIDFTSPVKIIALYLPQFHAIPENNLWWGEGFTEWSNVRPAIRQYDEQYQPHEPVELGYYDLSTTEAQHEQVKLAREYGISGFCFYFYWFDKKTLLETPIQNYLADKSLDLPFCLCWANENWTRRWDGLDSELLISQNHSPEDDLEFIAHISQYMTDGRYIRFDGKPLIIVYRPSLLPNAYETSERWRAWCRENGVGEIYIALTHSFDSTNPAAIGFDAAIEFPPNKWDMSRHDYTNIVQPESDDFNGSVYDWTVFLERESPITETDYTLFRSVNPSWDNTARRKNKSISFVKSSPRGYQQWLHNAAVDTIGKFPDEDSRLVFVNAWNEWAEGAHLEPDARYGYGYLEATRLALLRARIELDSTKVADTGKSLAVVIHAFYIDIFNEIIERLSCLRHLSLKLYVTTVEENEEAIRGSLEHSDFTYHLLTTRNHGRDVLPFLKILPEIIRSGEQLILKLHTKKSIHRSDGDEWRKDLLEKLASVTAADTALELFRSNPSLGILGPDGHMIPMSSHWGSNSYTVEKLSCRMGIAPRQLKELRFVAGTMFYARVRALLPLMCLNLEDSEFEEEAGQVDGTIAHAIERAITVSANAAGMEVRTFSEQEASQYKYTNFGFN